MKTEWQVKLKRILARPLPNGVLLFVICHDPEICIREARTFSPDAYVLLNGVTGMRNAHSGEHVFMIPQKIDINWLNINRPFLTTFPAKYVMFVTPEMYEEFRSKAPDFKDWASHTIFTFDEDSKIGGKVHVRGVEEDAQMKAAEIEELAKKDPVRALQNPNIPFVLFKSLIQNAPLAASQNPTFPLFLLEEPEFRGYVARFVPEWINDADWSKNDFWLGYKKEETAYFMKRTVFMREMVDRALPYLGNFAEHPIVVRCIAHIKGEGPDVSFGERKRVQDYANNHRDNKVPGSIQGYYAVNVVTTTSPATMLRFLAYAITGTAVNDNGKHDNTFIWGWNRFLQLAFGADKNTVIVGASDYALRVMAEIEKIQQAGVSTFGGIARELTKAKVAKASGQATPWSSAEVIRIIKASKLTPEDEKRIQEERIKKIRAAAQRQWENMTPEKLKENTSKQAEALKKKFAQMTPEQRIEHTAHARRGASSRLANMTPEEREAENRRLSAQMKKWIESLTPEEYEAYKAKLRENAADLAEKGQRYYQSLSEEEKQKIRKRISEHKTNWWNSLSAEELELQRQSLIDRLPKRIPMSEEEVAEWRKRLGMEDDGSIGKRTPEGDRELYRKWKSLINMTDKQLQRFLSSEEGKNAGLSRTEAAEQGIRSGHDSARALLRMIPSGKNMTDAAKRWTKTDWEWAKRQVSFISRMKGNAGPLFDEKGRKTRKHTSLLLWGHDPTRR